MKTLFDSMVKNKKIHCVLDSNQSQMLESYAEFNIQKRNKQEKMVKRTKKHTN